MSNSEVVYVKHFDCPIDLIQALEPSTGLFGRDVFFRGQADASWHLVPRAFRTFEQGGFVETRRSESAVAFYRSLVKRESRAVYEFACNADEHALSLPSSLEVLKRNCVFPMETNSAGESEPSKPVLRNWPPDEVMSAIGLAQHYGVPTRLLDFTRNPKVALYFACKDALLSPSNDSSRDVAIWAAGPGVAPFPGVSPVRVFHPEVNTNRNCAAQKGLFLYVRGLLGEEILDGSGLDQVSMKQVVSGRYFGRPCFYKLTIPSDHAGFLLRHLRDQEVHGASLFPGYEGYVRLEQERSLSEGGDVTADGKLRKLRAELIDRLVWSPFTQPYRAPGTDPQEP